MLRLAPGPGTTVRWWVVQLRAGGSWETHIIDGAARIYALAQPEDSASRPDVVAVTAVRPRGKGKRAVGIAPALTAAFLLSL